MADATAPSSVAHALDAVNRWKSEEESRFNSELAEVDQEVASLRTAIENLNQQLEALGRFRGDLLGKVEGLATEVGKKSYDAVFAVLAGQLDAIGGRSAELAEVEAQDDASVLATLSDPGLNNLIAEYEQFRTVVEPTLQTMPPTYRAAMEKLRDTQRDQLAERLGALESAPPASSGAAVDLEVLVAVDAPDGAAEVLMLVVPVSEEVYSGWEDRAEDLQTRIAARVLQGVYKAGASLGQPALQAVFGGHQGVLALEVELAGGEPDRVAETVRGHVEAALKAGAEIGAARVIPRVSIVDVDHLLPPEEAADVEVSGD